MIQFWDSWGFFWIARISFVVINCVSSTSVNGHVRRILAVHPKYYDDWNAIFLPNDVVPRWNAIDMSIHRSGSSDWTWTTATPPFIDIVSISSMSNAHSDDYRDHCAIAQLIRIHTVLCTDDDTSLSILEVWWYAELLKASRWPDEVNSRDTEWWSEFWLIDQVRKSTLQRMTICVYISPWNGAHLTSALFIEASTHSRWLKMCQKTELHLSLSRVPTFNSLESFIILLRLMCLTMEFREDLWCETERHVSSFEHVSSMISLHSKIARYY